MSLNPQLIGLLPGEEKRVRVRREPCPKTEVAMSGSDAALAKQLPEESSEFSAGGSTRCFGGGGAMDVNDRIYTRELEEHARSQAGERVAQEQSALDGFYQSRARKREPAVGVKVKAMAEISRKRVRAAAVLKPSFRRRVAAPGQQPAGAAAAAAAAVDLGAAEKSAALGSASAASSAAVLVQGYSSSSSGSDSED
jgi:hypothetical protein